MTNVLISTVITEEWPVEIEMKSTMINPGDLCENRLTALVCCPVYFSLGQVCFGLCCMQDTNLFCSEARISFHDTNKELKFSYWNWYFPCFKYNQTIPYSSIEDVVSYVQHNTTHNLDGTDTKRDMYFPVIVTKDGANRQLYQMGMLNWKSSAKRLNSTSTPSPVELKNCGGFWSIQYVQGLHHFLFGRLSGDKRPVTESTKYFKEGSYLPPSVESMCVKHTNTEYTETVYSSA